jgi:hypothetical protein
LEGTERLDSMDVPTIIGRREEEGLSDQSSCNFNTEEKQHEIHGEVGRNQRKME